MSNRSNLSDDKIRKIKEIEHQISKVSIRQSTCRSDREIEMFDEYIEFLEQHIEDIIYDADELCENEESETADTTDTIDKINESNQDLSKNKTIIDTKHVTNIDIHLKKESTDANRDVNISKSSGGRRLYSYKPSEDTW